MYPAPVRPALAAAVLPILVVATAATLGRGQPSQANTAAPVASGATPAAGSAVRASAFGRAPNAEPPPPSLSDAEASKRLEAIEEGPLAEREYETAEAELLRLADACITCSAELQARCWVLIGVSRSARADDDGAASAFLRAFTLHPYVRLDTDYAADPQTAITFDRVRSEVGRALAGRAPPVPARPPRPEQEGIPLGGEPGTLECTPEVRAVELLRPIPIHCFQQDPNQPAPARMEIRYRPFDSEQKWAVVPMIRAGKGYQGTIPCRATQRLGKLEVLIRGLDAEGRTIEYLGDDATPILFDIRRYTSAPPPAFPDRPAPPKCELSEHCPPGIPGCISGSTVVCESDEECLPGRCDASGACVARECRRTLDCSGDAACVRGTCQRARKPRHRLGFEAMLDLPVAGGAGVCRPREEGREFGCFLPDETEPYPGITQRGNSGETSIGIQPGSARVLAAYELLLGPHWSLGVRAGWAFWGQPDLDSSQFLPVHGELRGQHTFLTDARLRPFVVLGGGIQTVDTRFEVQVVDCGLPDSDDFDASCALSREPQDPALVRRLEAVQRFGPAFVRAGGGALWAVGFRDGLRIEATYAQHWPAAGGVIQPSLGYYHAF